MCTNNYAQKILTHVFQASDVIASSYTLSVESFSQTSVNSIHLRIITKTFRLQSEKDFFQVWLCGVFLHISLCLVEIASSPEIEFYIVPQALYLADL